METKFTKGQWIKGTNTAKKDWMQIFCNGKLIAEAKELSKKGERKATDFDEEGANAHLISMAPEMLDALNEMVEAFKLSSNVPVSLNGAYFKCKELIKKATY